MIQTNTNEELAQGDELYNSVMKDLNTDLLTTNTENIDEKREGESDEDFALRMERYKNDFEECERRLGLMEDGQMIKARMAKNEKRRGIFKKEQLEHTEEVQHAEEELSSFDNA